MGASAAPFDVPDIDRCSEFVPSAISVDDTPVRLNLRIVLDGVSRGQADHAVAAAQSAYAPLNVALSVSYDRAAFSSSDALDLIDEVRSFYGGARPGGTHAVYVLTAKDLYVTDVGGTRNRSVIGYADCIGGVLYANRAFAVGEALPDDPFLGLGVDLAGKTLAHELGHLAGAHHHYANCAESLTALEAPCTVMINAIDLAALVFSSVNRVMIRGHAQLLPPLPPAASVDGGGGALGAATWVGLLALRRVGALRRRQFLLVANFCNWRGV